MSTKLFDRIISFLNSDCRFFFFFFENRIMATLHARYSESY